MFKTILFTSFSVMSALAIPSPNAPTPGTKFNMGGDCTIGWDADTTGKWTTMNIQLMAGPNLAMQHLTSTFLYFLLIYGNMLVDLSNHLNSGCYGRWYRRKQQHLHISLPWCKPLVFRVIFHLDIELSALRLRPTPPSFFTNSRPLRSPPT